MFILLRPDKLKNPNSDSLVFSLINGKTQLMHGRKYSSLQRTRSYLSSGKSGHVPGIASDFY